VGEPLLAGHRPALARSRVVHASIDPSVPITTKKKIGEAKKEDADEPAAAVEGDTAETGGDTDGTAGGDGEDEGEAAANPDRTITNARLARPQDGLFSTDELAALYAEGGAPVRSAYDSAQRSRPGVRICGPRLEIAADRLGHHEPEWTSYTLYWKTVLGGCSG
jgi:RNA exonuclease NGL2